MRPIVLLTGALLALSGAAAAQTTLPASAPAPALSPQERAQADAAAVRARAAAAMKARTEAEAATKTTGFAPVANAQLVYGDYVCTQNSWDAAGRRMNFTPKGTIQFNANGTYRYLDGGGVVGRYTYDATTRQVIWITGYFAEHGPPKTSFTVDDKAAQLSIEFSEAGNTQTWSCGCNKK